MVAPGQRIGLLGGSFNPAHAGHLHVSIEAKKRLKLDKVVWLLSPQNPLKSRSGMADYATRLAHARTLTAAYPFITVTDYESRHQLFYSLETITHLKTHHPRTHFVWLMGADNLANFHLWRGWESIFCHIPIAVFDRAPFAHHALHSKAAIRYAAARLPANAAAQLSTSPTPCWSYIFMPRHPESATNLRNSLGEKAFL